MTIFVTCKYLVQCNGAVFGEKPRRIIMIYGLDTLGIYLWHSMILSYLPFIDNIWVRLLDMKCISPMILVIIMCILMFFICDILAEITKKVLILKHII